MILWSALLRRPLLPHNRVHGRGTEAASQPCRAPASGAIEAAAEQGGVVVQFPTVRRTAFALAFTAVVPRGVRMLENGVSGDILPSM